MVITVTMMFNPPSIEDSPNEIMAILKRIWPESPPTDKGAYDVQPALNEPSNGALSSPIATGGTSQKLSALRRGNAISAAPIWIGMM
jgi:hypothetical protein